MFNFSIDRDVLLEAIEITTAIASEKNTLPISENIRFSLKNGALEIESNNSQIAYRTQLPITVNSLIDNEDKTVLIDAKRIVQILKSLNPCILDFSENNLQIKISAQNSKSKFNVSYMNGADFPEFPVMENIDNQFSIDANILFEALNNVYYCCSNDNTRFTLNGVFFKSINGKVDCVATDGRRLCITKIEGKDNISFVLPIECIKILMRKLPGQKEIDVQYNQNFIEFHIGNVSLISTLIDNRFPDYSKVIPDYSNSVPIEINVQELLVKVNRVFSIQPTHNQIVLNFSENNLTLKCQGELGTAIDEYDLYNTQVLELGLNVLYLKETLSKIKSDTVFLYMQAPNSPIVLLDKEIKHLIMPMQIVGAE